MNSANKREFKLITLPTTSSTNTYLKECIEKTLPWDSVRAIEQTGGRGRFERRWISEPNRDLTFSTVVPVSAKIETFLPNITQMVALSVGLLLDSLGIEYQIKWPNDILVDGKKICGILVEGIFREKQYVVVGIGLNVNSLGGTYDNIEATSLAKILNRESDLEELLITIVTNLQKTFVQVEQEGLSFLIRYLNNHLAFLDEEREITSYNTSYRGEIKRVNSEGALVISCQGEEEQIISGEISFK